MYARIISKNSRVSFLDVICRFDIRSLITAIVLLITYLLFLFNIENVGSEKRLNMSEKNANEIADQPKNIEGFSLKCETKRYGI